MCYIQCLFPSSGSVGEVVINQTNYEGCQFDVHCIQCQTSIDILGIVNVFVQYVQNYFQDVYIAILPTIGDTVFCPKKQHNGFYKNLHNSGMVGRKKLPDPSLNSIFNALLTGVPIYALISVN